MTSQTIEAPQTGADAHQVASEALPPAPIYPASGKLQKALSDYQAALEELWAYQGKASRVQADEEKLLGDSTLSEEESLRALSEFHARKTLYGSRIKGMEAKLAGLLTELGNALAEAVRELTHVVVTELEKQREIMVDRLIAVLEINDRGVVPRKELFNVTRFSKPLNALEVLKPSPVYNAKDMPAEDVVRSAQSVLKALEAFKLEVGKDI